MANDQRDVFRKVYSLRWRTPGMRAPAGLENKQHQWQVPRLHFEKAGVAELASEIIMGESESDCLFGGMRNALVEYTTVTAKETGALAFPASPQLVSAVSIARVASLTRLTQPA